MNKTLEFSKLSRILSDPSLFTYAVDELGGG
jgi:hypothetical protein